MIVAIRVRQSPSGGAYESLRLVEVATISEVFAELTATARHYTRVRHGTPPSDSVDILRQGTGDSEHEPGRASVRRAKNCTRGRLVGTVWRGGRQNEAAKDGTGCMNGNRAPAAAPGSERSCSGLASGWSLPPYGACAIAERIVSLQPPGGRSCWRAHPGCHAEAGGEMSSQGLLDQLRRSLTRFSTRSGG